MAPAFRCSGGRNNSCSLTGEAAQCYRIDRIARSSACSATSLLVRIGHAHLPAYTDLASYLDAPSVLNDKKKQPKNNIFISTILLQSLLFRFLHSWSTSHGSNGDLAVPLCFSPLLLFVLLLFVLLFLLPFPLPLLLFFTLFLNLFVFNHINLDLWIILHIIDNHIYFTILYLCSDKLS